MYKIIESVIENRKFNLSDILDKIDTQWVQGNISQEEQDSLVALARERAVPQNSIDVYKKIEELENRVKLLEDAASGGEQSISEFVVGKTYFGGDEITFEGKRYVCTAPLGAVCVWSPSAYPAYWKLA